MIIVSNHLSHVQMQHEESCGPHLSWESGEHFDRDKRTLLVMLEISKAMQNAKTCPMVSQTPQNVQINGKAAIINHKNTKL